jgi:hypothetical protein
VVAFLSPVMAQHTAFSTHDWTLSPGGEVVYAEAWADVKTPGGMPAMGSVGDQRRTYVVGSVEVPSSAGGASPAMFSNHAVKPLAGAPSFTGGKRPTDWSARRAA